MASRPRGKRKMTAAASSLGEEIYRRIRRDIIGCVFVPGESCSESQLADLYGVGKAPVRWALAALSREHVQDIEMMMAGAVITVAPVLILFLALQRYYIRGMLAGSVKG